MEFVAMLVIREKKGFKGGRHWQGMQSVRAIMTVAMEGSSR